MINKKTKEGKFIIRNSTTGDAKQMEKVQLICFPTLAPHELLTKEQFANHIKIFPEGQ